jgi:hypothetical protein
MENESEKQTVVGKTGSELTEQKINSAIAEIKDFINDDAILRDYRSYVYRNLLTDALIVEIRNKNLPGMSHLSVRSLLLKEFENSILYWIDSVDFKLRFYYTVL